MPVLKDYGACRTSVEGADRSWPVVPPGPPGKSDRISRVFRTFRMVIVPTRRDVLTSFGHLSGSPPWPHHRSR